MSLVTVFTSFSSAEAHVVRSRLEASNFHAVVIHELSALNIDGYSMAAGGIKVQVPEDEEAEARELIEAGRGRAEPGVPEDPV